MIMRGEQVVLSVVGKCTIKFLTIKTVKSAEILYRLRAQFSDKMPSRTQVYDWSKSFEKGQTEVENMAHARWLRTSVNEGNDEQIDGLMLDTIVSRSMD
jgi:hypothetical protein